MPKLYPNGFREQAVQKAITSKDKSVKVIAQELNIGYSTLQHWIREFKSVTSQKDNKRPQDWSQEQQFQALMDTASMTKEQRSQYCREKGLFPRYLDRWRNDFIRPEKKAASSDKADSKRLEKENTALRKEILRKDKALAEAAALLVLQKKFQALMEEKDE